MQAMVKSRPGVVFRGRKYRRLVTSTTQAQRRMRALTEGYYNDEYQVGDNAGSLFPNNTALIKFYGARMTLTSSRRCRRSLVGKAGGGNDILDWGGVPSTDLRIIPSHLHIFPLRGRPNLEQGIGGDDVITRRKACRTRVDNNLLYGDALDFLASQLTALTIMDGASQRGAGGC